MPWSSLFAIRCSWASPWRKIAQQNTIFPAPLVPRKKCLNYFFVSFPFTANHWRRTCNSKGPDDGTWEAPRIPQVEFWISDIVIGVSYGCGTVPLSKFHKILQCYIIMCCRSLSYFSQGWLKVCVELNVFAPLKFHCHTSLRVGSCRCSEFQSSRLERRSWTNYITCFREHLFLVHWLGDTSWKQRYLYKNCESLLASGFKHVPFSQM